jgi:hypothetical protein
MKWMRMGGKILRKFHYIAHFFDEHTNLDVQFNTAKDEVAGAVMIVALVGC